MSPSHQVRQTDPKSREVISLPASRLVTPMLALIVVLTMPPRSTNATTSRTRSSDGRKSTTSRRRYAPTSPSSVFPTVIPSTV
jgi:hypothetical protein